MAKRGRPKKVNIEIISDPVRDGFDLRMYGIKRDPKLDYRWVARTRLEERTHVDGYKTVQKENGDDVKYRGMTLMARPRKALDESSRRKEILTRQRTSSVKESLHQELEGLSRKWDQDLHKAVDDSQLE